MTGMPDFVPGQSSLASPPPTPQAPPQPSFSGASDPSSPTLDISLDPLSALNSRVVAPDLPPGALPAFNPIPTGRSATPMVPYGPHSEGMITVRIDEANQAMASHNNPNAGGAPTQYAPPPVYGPGAIPQPGYPIAPSPPAYPGQIPFGQPQIAAPALPVAGTVLEVFRNKVGLRQPNIIDCEQGVVKYLAMAAREIVFAGPQMSSLPIAQVMAQQQQRQLPVRGAVDSYTDLVGQLIKTGVDVKTVDWTGTFTLVIDRHIVAVGSYNGIDAEADEVLMICDSRPLADVLVEQIDWAREASAQNAAAELPAFDVPESWPPALDDVAPAVEVAPLAVEVAPPAPPVATPKRRITRRRSVGARRRKVVSEQKGLTEPNADAVNEAAREGRDAGRDHRDAVNDDEPVENKALDPKGFEHKDEDAETSPA